MKIYIKLKNLPEWEKHKIGKTQAAAPSFRRSTQLPALQLKPVCKTGVTGKAQSRVGLLHRPTCI